MPIPAASEKPLYSGTFDCLKKTVKNEGFKGLYKGMGAPLAGVAPIFAISFLGYGVGKQIFGPTPPEKFTPLHYFAAGSFSGIFTTTIMAPGERIKCLLQIQEGSHHPKVYDGPLDCAKKLYKEGGIRSIYRGAGATLVRGMFIIADIMESTLNFELFGIIFGPSFFVRIKFQMNRQYTNCKKIAIIQKKGLRIFTVWLL